MITRYRIGMAIGCLTLVFASSAWAGPINFGNNAITFTNPSVTHGDGTTAAIVPNVPTLKKLADGLSVVDFSYTATITALPAGAKAGLVYIDWTAARTGNLGKMTDLTLTTSGNTDITTASPANVIFSISGKLDSGAAAGPNGNVLFLTSFDGPAMNKAIEWNDSNTWESVAAGNRTLTLTSEIRWDGVVVGDKLTASSEYILQATPEPTSLLLALVGFVGIAIFRRARDPNRRAALPAM